MAKVELLTAARAPLLARPYYERGDPGPIASALAQVPELMDAAMPFIGATFGPTAVPSRWKEIVVLRVSAANGCRYCTETHTGVARRLGFTPEELACLRGEAPAPASFGRVELALVAFSDVLSCQPAEAVAVLRGHFDEPQIVELVTLASATVMLNRFATALELPV
jgi:AhpD family alkylhydroperoxidase